MFNVSTLLLDDTLKQVTPLINGVINEMLPQFAPLSDISLLDCDQIVEPKVEMDTMTDRAVSWLPVEMDPVIQELLRKTLYGKCGTFISAASA